MPSAANAKSEKPASSEALDNSPVRQIMTIIEHKIRNLEKRKSKLTSYRDLQKAGKELNGDQKVAVAKYNEVVQTLEFARDISKQVLTVATVAERDAKKQAKKDAWIRYTSETNKIREVLLVLDCLNQMGNTEAREDFLNGANGAAKLTEDDLKVLDELYPEVTPKHEVNEEGLPGFHSYTIKAAEHLYAIIDGKPKEFLGTTYAHIKEVINAVHDCGYFDKSTEVVVAVEPEECPAPEEEPEPVPAPPEPEPAYAPAPLPAPPAPAGLPPPAYPLRPLPPITLQEVEHAYFAQQYPQQRPISEVIGSQNFFFLQESEIDSPIGTPQPPPVMTQQGSPAAIPTQTFTNQHYVLPGGRVAEPGSIPMPPQPHFPPHAEPVPYPAAPLPHVHGPAPPQPAPQMPQPVPQMPQMPQPPPVHVEQQIPTQPEEREPPTPVEHVAEDDSKESRSPERDDSDRKTQGQGDGQNRFRRYRGGGGGRGPSNGFRGRGSFQNRQNSDNYHGRHGEYQNRSSKDGYRQYGDNYQSRHGKDGYQNRSGNDGYYGNGDTGDSHHHENGGRERYNDAGYQGGFKSRGRGGPRGARGAPRAPRPHQYARKQDNAE